MINLSQPPAIPSFNYGSPEWLAVVAIVVIIMIIGAWLAIRRQR